MSDALSQLMKSAKEHQERQQQLQQQQQQSSISSSQSQPQPIQLQQLFAQVQQQAAAQAQQQRVMQQNQLFDGGFSGGGSGGESGTHTPVLQPPPMLSIPPPPALPQPPPGAQQLQAQFAQLQQIHLLQQMLQQPPQLQPQQLAQLQQLQQMQQIQQIQQLQQRLAAAAAISQQQQQAATAAAPANTNPWPQTNQRLPSSMTEQELQQFLYATQQPPPQLLQHQQQQHQQHQQQQRQQSTLSDTSNNANANANNLSGLLPSLAQIPLPNRDALELDPTQSVLDEFNKLSLLKPSSASSDIRLGVPEMSSSHPASSSASGINVSGGGGTNPNSSILSTSSLNDSQNNPDVIFQADRYYMPGTASLIADVDKLIMVILRDGKTLIGYLRSIDQYANLLLSSTMERVHVGKKYGDISRGCYIVRGENVVLIGEVDWELPSRVLDMVRVSEQEIIELQREDEKRHQEMEKSKKKALTERCMLPSSHSDFILDDYY